MPFTHFTLTFNISLTIRPTTIKPSIVLLLNVQTPQVPWLGDLDWVTLTYISCSIDFYISLPYVLNCKAFNHQTLYSASSQCTDLGGALTWWPWPIFCTPVTLTHFTLMFGISSNIRPTTTKPCIVLHLIALAWQVPWPGDLDLYLTHFTLMSDNLNYKAYNHHTLHSAPLWCTELAGTLTHDLDLYFTLQWLLHILRRRSIICIIRKVSAEDIAIRGNGTGLEYMCPTRHVVYIFFNPVFQLSTAKNEINLLNNHILIVAPVTFAPAGAMMPSAEFLLTPKYTHNQNSLLWLVLSIVMKKNGITYEFYEIKQMV